MAADAPGIIAEREKVWDKRLATDRSRRETDEVSSEFDGSPLAALVETIEAGLMDVDVYVGTAGEDKRGEFVKIDGLPFAQVGAGLAVEAWPDARERFQVAYYAEDLAGSQRGRQTVGELVASSAEWMIDVGSEDVFVDQSVQPWLWVSLFTVVRP